MEKDYRKQIYEKYITNQFSQAVDVSEIEKEYDLQELYFIKNYLKYMPIDKAAKIIDVGCGMGAFLNFCKNQGYTNILGIDLSEENVEFCKNQGLNAVKVNMFEYLQDRKETFDCIVCSDVVEHLDRQDVFALLTIMRNALISSSKTGNVLIKVPNMSNPYVGPASLSIDFTHMYIFTELSLKQVLTTIGFSDVTIVGTDIYVRKNITNFLAKQIARLLCFELYLKSWIFGRKSIKIFQKNILAIAKK